MPRPSLANMLALFCLLLGLFCGVALSGVDTMQEYIQLLIVVATAFVIAVAYSLYCSRHHG